MSGLSILIEKGSGWRAAEKGQQDIRIVLDKPRTLRRIRLEKRLTNCACPVWVQGRLHGKMLRKSLGIRNWESAQKIVRDWEARIDVSMVSVKDAFERYIADCEARHLRSETLRKYRLMQRDLLGEFGGRPLDAVRIEALSRYREKWELAPWHC
jgi:hypothetical protein